MALTHLDVVYVMYCNLKDLRPQGQGRGPMVKREMEIYG